MRKEKPLYRAGQIVVVTHRDGPHLPTNQYIGYIREDASTQSGIIPLINKDKDINGYDSRVSLKYLDLSFFSISDIERLNRGRKIKRPRLGELYEVLVNDPNVCSRVPDGCEGLSYRMVGCYAGTRSAGGHNHFVFSNVCETDPEKLKETSRDTTNGRRIFNRVRQNGNLVIKRLLRRWV